MTDITTFHLTAGLPFPTPLNWQILRPAIVYSCQESLKRMGVEQVELYQVRDQDSVLGCAL